MGTRFARWLTQAMARADLNQPGLAALVGRTQSAVSHWLRGKAEPADDVIKPMARALHVPVEDVYSALGRIPPQNDDGLTDAGREILARLRELDPDLQEMAADHVERLVVYLQGLRESGNLDNETEDPE